MKAKAKKGYDVKALVGLGITFLVIAIVLGFGSTILTNMQDDIRKTTTVRIENETTTSLGADADNTLAQATKDNFISCTFVTAYNVTTDDRPLASGNFTTDSTRCLITWTEGEELLAGYGNDTDLNITYDLAYYVGNADYNASGYGLDSIVTISDWLPTLALIIIAAVIIGVIIRYFMVGDSSRSEY